MSLQFVSAHQTSTGPPTAVITWVDLTKFGRLGTKDLNYAVGVISQVLSKHPQKAVALVLAPHLTSEKVRNGQRGEIRYLGHMIVMEGL